MKTLDKLKNGNDIFFYVLEHVNEEKNRVIWADIGTVISVDVSGGWRTITVNLEHRSPYFIDIPKEMQLRTVSSDDTWKMSAKALSPTTTIVFVAESDEDFNNKVLDGYDDSVEMTRREAIRSEQFLRMDFGCSSDD